jgi:protein TonB
MTANTGVLLQVPPTGRPFAMALGLHASVVLVIAISGWINSSGPQFGDPNAGGASVGIEAVDKIPLPVSGRRNPLANDSESETPQAPVKPNEKTQKEVDSPDAVKLSLKKSKAKPAKEASAKTRFRPFDELEKNQIYSKSAPRLSSELFSQKPGSGTVGTGANTTLGTRFGGYAQQIQEQIARKWQTGDVNVRSAPLVIATFDLMRDGSIRNLAILQGSGISALDFSVRRAIQDASPFPPIPPGFDKDHAKCEFTFELKK